jgi:hypothetical protein
MLWLGAIQLTPFEMAPTLAITKAMLRAQA